MKYFLSLSILFLLTFCQELSCGSLTQINVETATAPDTVIIFNARELENLTTLWISEYKRVNPATRFKVSGFTGSKPAKKDAIWFITDDFSGVENTDPDWKISIGHNAIVTVFNKNNPASNAISSQGITAADFAKILSGETVTKWSEIVDGSQTEQITVYFSDDQKTRDKVSEFLKVSPIALKGIMISGIENFISAVRNDRNAIGLCSLNDLRKPGLNEIADGIMLLPVDKNNNGRIDSFEKIYENPDALLRGIWTGKYPHTLSGTIYAASSEKPVNNSTVAFLEWIITEGGQYLSSNGYCGLSGMEKEAGLTALQDNEVILTAISEKSSSYLWLIILVVLLAAGIVIFMLVAILTGKKEADVVNMEVAFKRRPVTENMITAPKGVWFDKSHLWSFMEKDGLIRIGVDDFIQHLTGDLTGVILKELGVTVRRGEAIMTVIKDGKQLNLYAPVSGKIKSQNTDLYIDPSIINASPYIDGWVYLIEPKNWLREMQLMFMADRYKEWVKEEFGRLRSFLETCIKPNDHLVQQLVLQDGGELSDNLLSELGPEVWVDFQTSFIDTSR